MHRLRSKSAVHRLRFAAFLFCLQCALVPLAALFLAYAILMSDTQLTIAAMGISALCAALFILQWLIAQRTNCPLCITPVLAKRNCSKSRHAKTLFGSHRLRTALSIIFTNSFRCPYCNEPTALEVRERRLRQPYSQS